MSAERPQILNDETTERLRYPRAKPELLLKAIKILDVPPVRTQLNFYLNEGGDRRFSWLPEKEYHARRHEALEWRPDLGERFARRAPHYDGPGGVVDVAISGGKPPVIEVYINEEKGKAGAGFEVFRQKHLTKLEEAGYEPRFAIIDFTEKGAFNNKAESKKESFTFYLGEMELRLGKKADPLTKGELSAWFKSLPKLK